MFVIDNDVVVVIYEVEDMKEMELRMMIMMSTW
jgi:hypothetical protein